MASDSLNYARKHPDVDYEELRKMAEMLQMLGAWKVIRAGALLREQEL